MGDMGEEPSKGLRGVVWQIEGWFIAHAQTGMEGDGEARKEGNVRLGEDGERLTRFNILKVIPDLGGLV